MTTQGKTRSLRVTGRVQGVSYRAWTQRTARNLGLRGWVRNDPDGAVSAVLHGPSDAVAGMIDAMRTGPAEARVSNIEVAPARCDALPEGFDILD